jgi:hypothetical protein
MASYEPLTATELKLVRLALADRVNRLDALIKEFPNAVEPVITDRRDETQALRDKLLYTTAILRRTT